MTGHGFFRTRLRVLATLGPLLVLAAIALQVSACRACNITGVFDFCRDEGPHEVIQDPPAAWRARCADVQDKLAAYVARVTPNAALPFYRRDPATLVFVRVLGVGIPDGAMRTDGDTILMNPEVEGNAGDMRHECVHWVQPNNNDALTPRDAHGRQQIHTRPVFEAAIAPLIAGIG